MVLLPGCRCCVSCGYAYPDKVLVDLANSVGEQYYQFNNIIIQNDRGTFESTSTVLIRSPDFNGAYELTLDSNWQGGGQRYVYDDTAVFIETRIGSPLEIARQVTLGVHVKPPYRIKYKSGLDNSVSAAEMEAETWDDDCVQTGYTFFSFGPDPNSYPACHTLDAGVAAFSQQCSVFFNGLYRHFFAQTVRVWLTDENGNGLVDFSRAWQQHPPNNFPWRLRWRLRERTFGFDITGCRLVYGDSEVEFPFL